MAQLSMGGLVLLYILRLDFASSMQPNLMMEEAWVGQASLQEPLTGWSGDCILRRRASLEALHDVASPAT